MRTLGRPDLTGRDTSARVIENVRETCACEPELPLAVEVFTLAVLELVVLGWYVPTKAGSIHPPGRRFR
jgi:hypothetical protein